MSFNDLQAIVGTALVDRRFCELLLSSPQMAMSEFDLSEAEFQAVTAIRARNLEEFAAKLDGWIDRSPGSRRERDVVAERRPEAYQLAG